jgi:DNA-binding transcriptional LysR family regulator
MVSKRLPFELAELQVFLAVCETRTMVKAAQLLGITQPAVSNVILDIEQRLAIQLFDRSIRPIALTPAGTILYEHATTLMTEARHAETLLQRSQRGQLPIVRVGLVDSVSRLLSVPLVSALLKSSVQVVVQTGLATAHASALLTRQLDLLIGVDEQTGANDLAEVAGLERRTVVREPYLLLTPAGAGVDLTTLTHERPLIRYNLRSQTGHEIERYLTRLGLNPARGVQFDKPFGVTASVAAGLGWAITTPLCLLQAQVPVDSCVISPLPQPGLTRSLIVVNRPKELGAIPREAANAAVDVIREQCQRHLRAFPSWVLAAMSFGEQAPAAKPALSRGS